jgi:hypothetical protein
MKNKNSVPNWVFVLVLLFIIGMIIPKGAKLDPCECVAAFVIDDEELSIILNNEDKTTLEKCKNEYSLFEANEECTRQRRLNRIEK